MNPHLALASTLLAFVLPALASTSARSDAGTAPSGSPVVLRVYSDYV